MMYKIPDRMELNVSCSQAKGLKVLLLIKQGVRHGRMSMGLFRDIFSVRNGNVGKPIEILSVL